MTGHNVDTKTVSDSFLRCLCVCCIQSNDISELLILIPGHYPGPDADTDNYNRKLQEVKTRSGWRCPDWSTLIIFQKIEIQTITGQVNGLGVSAGGSGPLEAVQTTGSVDDDNLNDASYCQKSPTGTGKDQHVK